MTVAASRHRADGCVVTGIGIESGFGDLAATWDAVVAGCSAVRMTGIPGVAGWPELPAAPGLGTVPPLAKPDRKLVKYMSPAVRMAVIAAGRALADAGLADDPERREGSALLVATDLIGFDPGEVAPAVETAKSERGDLDLAQFGGDGLRRCHPLLPFKILLNMPLGMVSIVFGLRGENAVFYPGAGQGGACLAAAVRGIASGRFDRVLCGATSNGVSLLPAATLARLGHLAGSPAAAIPYAGDHRGFAPADAAAFLVLESAPAADARAARVRARLAVGTDQGYLPLAAEPRFAMRRALWARVAGAQPPELLVSAGNLDADEDRAELQALARLWPGLRPRVTSFDGSLGFTGAAAPALAVALATEMIQRQAPLGLSGPDPSQLGSVRPLACGNSLSPLERVVVSAGDRDGGAVVALVERPEVAA